MTKHYELIGGIPGNIYKQKIFAALSVIFDSNSTQCVGGGGGGNVNNRLVIFIFPTGNE